MNIKKYITCDDVILSWEQYMLHKENDNIAVCDSCNKLILKEETLYGQDIDDKIICCNCFDKYSMCMKCCKYVEKSNILHIKFHGLEGYICKDCNKTENLPEYNEKREELINEYLIPFITYTVCIAFSVIFIHGFVYYESPFAKMVDGIMWFLIRFWPITIMLGLGSLASIIRRLFR